MWYKISPLNCYISHALIYADVNIYACEWRYRLNTASKYLFVTITVSRTLNFITEYIKGLDDVKRELFVLANSYEGNTVSI